MVAQRPRRGGPAPCRLPCRLPCRRRCPPVPALLLALFSVLLVGAAAFRQVPLLYSPPPPEQVASGLPSRGGELPQRSLRLNHVLHRTTSRFGSKIVRKELDDDFFARAASAPAKAPQAAGPPGEQFAYSPVVDGTGAEVGFDHLVKVNNVRRENAFPRAGAPGAAVAPEANVVDLRLDEVILPDVSDVETVVSLAKMCYNAYLELGSDEWMDLGKKTLTNSSFGWSEDGLRGYVFADESEQLVIIAFKGTTAGSLLKIFESPLNATEGLLPEVTATGVDTIARDKLNDNLLFSCCCARVSWTWTPVCGCYQQANTCSQLCVEDSLIFQDSYYQMALELYAATALKYPKATIWLTGHSLGGGIASLTALTFGAPSVSFEAPGDMLAAKRLHLPMYPGYDHGKSPHWSIGHTADPIFTGTCTGFSACSIGGYALETKCHIGQTIVYDTVADKGWRADIRNHRMKDVLEKILKAYDAVPPARFDPSCDDCGAWTYN